MGKKVVTFGEIMLRLSPNGYYRLFQNDQMQATFGGAEANTAVSLANYGVDSIFVTKVPNNAIGIAAIRTLRGLNVDASQIALGGERLGIYYMEKGVSQRPSLCIYDRAHSAVSEASPDDFDWGQIFAGADWFHFTGITPALSENCAAICARACEAAKQRGIVISCDLNYRSKLWNRDSARQVMTKLCQYVDICIANEEDAKNVFGIEANNSDINAGRIDKTGYQSVAAQLKQLFGFKNVAITLRTSISASNNKWVGMLYDGNDYYFSREYDICIVDRVGGGDSFCSGLIYCLMQGMPGQKCIDFATAASALKHSIEGDFNRVTVDEVLKLAKGNGSGRIER